ncbi:MAG: NAD(P)/FAD-dependent oxidoreductase [Chloroflexi bacterium]|nr:NAD(P)/FAD-dependent oxidoreductase [Chloroflexota bacterium]
MKPETCDVIVLGGGPAGCATAIALAREKFRVALIEKTRYDAPRIGETLAPAARVPLARLGALEKFLREDHAPSPATLAAWESAELAENHFIANPYGNGWHLDRNRFDARLAREAECAGVSVYEGVSARTVIGNWEVEIDESNRVAGKFLVDATGRAGIIARQQGAQRLECDRLVGLVKFFDARDAAPDNRTLVEASRDGWWYSAWLPDARVVVAYMTDADLKPSDPRALPEFWNARLAETRHTRARLTCHCEEPPFTFVQGKLHGDEANSKMQLGDCFARPARNDIWTLSASSYILDRVAGENWIAVGDAAMAVDPLSSRGIFNALESGLRAARAIGEKERGGANAFEEYAEETRAQYEKYLRARVRYYATGIRRGDSEFWKRRSEIISAPRPTNA